MVDPAFWVGAFLLRHAHRHPTYPWPADDSDAYVTHVETWVDLLRKHRATEEMADHASKALLLISHWPNNHVAEFFKAMPPAPPRYFEYDRDLAAHYASRAPSFKAKADERKAAEARRQDAAEANRTRSIEFLAHYRPSRNGGEVAS